MVLAYPFAYVEVKDGYWCSVSHNASMHGAPKSSYKCVVHQESGKRAHEDANIARHSFSCSRMYSWSRSHMLRATELQRHLVTTITNKPPNATNATPLCDMSCAYRNATFYWTVLTEALASAICDLKKHHDRYCITICIGTSWSFFRVIHKMQFTG